MQYANIHDNFARLLYLLHNLRRLLQDPDTQYRNVVFVVTDDISATV